MYLAFHLAVAPRQDDGGGDGFFVAKQSVTESVDFAHSDDADQSIRSDADQFGGKQRRAFSV